MKHRGYGSTENFITAVSRKRCIKDGGGQRGIQPVFGLANETYQHYGMYW